MRRGLYVLLTAVAALVVLTAPGAYAGTHAKRYARRRAAWARHRVRRGETLYSLARAHGLTVEELRRTNRLRGDGLSAGSVLKIPAGRLPGAGYVVHTVARGETLYSLGRRYGVELTLLRRLNHMKGSGLKAGQGFKVPASAPAKTALKTPPGGPDAASQAAAPETPAVTANAPSGSGQTSENPFSDPAVAEIERRYKGVPYRFGGSGRTGMDCSGFTRAVFCSIGLDLPRSAREQFQAGVPVKKSELRPGDLVFFSTYAKYPSHVGIYVGEGRFMHMSTGKGALEITGLDDEGYAMSYLGARRVLP